MWIIGVLAGLSVLSAVQALGVSRYSYYPAYNAWRRSSRIINIYEAIRDFYPVRDTYPCPSEIYCQGRLLHTVQMAQLYTDSKTFVDKKLRFTPTETLYQFEDLMSKTDDQPSRKQLEDFVNDFFEDGNELEYWTPPDWTESPKFIENIADVSYQKWAIDLNKLWTNLTRKITTDVRDNPQQYSIVYVPNGLVIPGGRFTEFYYWDTYWIIRGLLLSEMTTTARGILLNFLDMVDQFGFVPNGGRIYYLQRSQPPLLTPMVQSYFETTGDLDFLQNNIGLLEKEFQFWMNNRTVDVVKNGRVYRLASEDYKSAEFLPTQIEKEDLYIDLKSAAESGWDFSSRWFISNKTNQGNITQIHTRYIIPVDLNAFIYWNARILANFSRLLNNPDKAAQYDALAVQWQEAVQAVLWHEDLGVWLDYDHGNQIRRDYFYPSNLAPLWTGCYDQSKASTIAASVIKYIDNYDLMGKYLGGLPASLELTGEQWDMPNAWPPLQIIVIQGLDRMNDIKATEKGKDIARNWVHSNFIGFHKTKEMFEKYDAEKPGQYGGGGEYDVQAGFGWTNGVIMELLHRYGKEFFCDDIEICDTYAAVSTNNIPN